MGSDDYFRLSGDLIWSLHVAIIFTLEDAKARSPQAKGRQGWKTEKDIGLVEPLAGEWHYYVGNLVQSYIILKEDEDDVLYWFKILTNGQYTAKPGYTTVMEVVSLVINFGSGIYYGNFILHSKEK